MPRSETSSRFPLVSAVGVGTKSRKEGICETVGATPRSAVHSAEARGSFWREMASSSEGLSGPRSSNIPPLFPTRPSRRRPFPFAKRYYLMYQYLKTCPVRNSSDFDSILSGLIGYNFYKTNNIKT